MKLGLSGWLTKAALATPLMPLFLIASILLGSLALSAIPREEEPQISVPMVDIYVQANGLSAADAVELVTKPLETIVKSINSVEHVYSQTSDDHVLVMARFLVGTQEDDAILRVHEKLRANYDRLPAGIPEPLVVGRGINDVAVLTLTLSPKPEQASRWSRDALSQLAVKLQAEMAPQVRLGHRRDRVPGHRRVAVEAVAHAADRGEQVAERDVTAQRRGTHHHRRRSVPEHPPADLDGAADGPDPRR